MSRPYNPNLLLQFDLTANVWVSRCPTAAVLINVIVQERLFYSSNICVKYSLYCMTLKEKTTFMVELAVLHS